MQIGQRRLFPDTDVTAPRSDFALHHIKDTCRWVSKTGSYCFERNRKYVATYTDLSSCSRVRDLSGLTPELCDELFCTLHAAAAKPSCFNENAACGVLVTVDRNGQRNLASDQKGQMLLFGGDDMIHCDFQDLDTLPKHGALVFDALKRVATLPKLLEFHGDWKTERYDTQIDHIVSNNDVVNSEALDVVEVKEDEVEVKLEDDDFTSTSSAAARTNGFLVARPKSGPSQQQRSPSPRAERASRTMERDPIYNQDVRVAEKTVLQRLREDLVLKDDRPGYVYAIRDPELGLVKVGSTLQTISTRLGQLQNACKPGAPLVIVAGNDNKPVFEYKRLERLVQADLQAHRWYFRCPCGPKSDTKHQEWFDVSDDVVSRTLMLWKTAIMQNPYGLERLPPAPDRYPLVVEWLVKISPKARILAYESHDHHDLRLARWMDLLPESVATRLGLSKLELRSPAQDVKRPLAAKSHTRASSSTTSTKTQPIKFRGLSPEPSVTRSRVASAQAALESRTKQDPGTMHEPKLETVATPAKQEQQPGRPGLVTPERPRITAAKTVPLAPTFGNGYLTPERNPFEAPTPHEESVNPFSTPTPGPTRADRPLAPFHDVKSHIIRSQSTPTIVLPDQKPDERSTTRFVTRCERLVCLVKEELPPHVYNDVIRFRWQLAYAFTFGIFAPFIPAVLAVAVWCVFLPLFVGELRSWSFVDSASI
ncbi:hypothetical protein LTR09_007194 [Extremus antarcticus]|uniref:Bacteriophage T5 Orf172 DNA-binding domain-containing protein n=1 Tax=Extremus antarcticus TaxID=702011 RepID=A0AAJ0DCW1_9PEZI|nr:hypothetical protein LTR09_007194 [Extremus antarcticus]